MRNDLEACLARHGMRLADLAPFEQILLTTDGTVTEMLEAVAGEPMRVVKLGQEPRILAAPLPGLRAEARARVVRREILLSGRRSGTPFLHAESWIAPDHLDARVRAGLEDSDKPVGLLLLEHRIETFKEILDCGQAPAAAIARHFGISADTAMLQRTYRMVSGGVPILLITERFPAGRFRGPGIPAPGTG